MYTKTQQRNSFSVHKKTDKKAPKQFAYLMFEKEKNHKHISLPINLNQPFPKLNFPLAYKVYTVFYMKVLV